MLPFRACFMCFASPNLCSSSDENEKTEDRRAFKRDFLAALEARLLEIRDRGRGVVLVW